MTNKPVEAVQALAPGPPNVLPQLHAEGSVSVRWAQRVLEFKGFVQLGRCPVERHRRPSFRCHMSTGLSSHKFAAPQGLVGRGTQRLGAEGLLAFVPLLQRILQLEASPAPIVKPTDPGYEMPVRRSQPPGRTL
jgi:hypothetical protein